MLLNANQDGVYSPVESIRKNELFLSAILPKSSLHRTTFTRLPPPGTHFTAESTEAMRIKCLAQGHRM